MKIISLVNFMRGGKSSLARLLAEKMETSILNFDPKRNAEFYNAVPTNNIPEDAKIIRNDDSIKVISKINTMTITSNKDMFICDFGGRFDTRINEFQSDVYILPMQYDFESINETIRATKYILSENENAFIIHVLNMYGCNSKKKRDTFKIDYEELIILNKLKDIPYHIMPSSELIAKIINNKMKISDIVGNSNFLKKGAYKNILTFVSELIETINRREK